MKAGIEGLLVLMGIVSVLEGCGTVTTVFRDGDVVARELKANRTYCQTVPRVYSGVAYDLCVLHAPPHSGSGVSLNDVPWAFIDVPISGVLDTLILPYTIYRQNVDGSIELR
ncbi:YceK/YidQ family lipoprotein [Pseudomonas sp. MWU15-20650]|uniref:YceK/YidQ family lipoprotein n=1 Tax=Pseudomonas sp. MWU15-20650 TaxID=2933107 RepID=UPI00200C9DDF|nr:YceK/YidQ family lipoprotein [Pseudomonas sp. MWU15-20650]